MSDYRFPCIQSCSSLFVKDNPQTADSTNDFISCQDSLLTSEPSSAT